MLEYIALEQQEQQEVYMLGQRQLPESQVNQETGLPLIPVRDEITGMTVYFQPGQQKRPKIIDDYEKALKRTYPNPIRRTWERLN